jgi:hypothetical protein
MYLPEVMMSCFGKSWDASKRNNPDRPETRSLDQVDPIGRPWASCLGLRRCNESLSTCEVLALTHVGIFFD